MAGFTQDYPLEIALDGQPLRAVFVATNGTGYRQLPEFNITLEVPSEASVTIRTDASRAFAFDEPLMEDAPGVAVDQNYPRRANLRVFGETSMEWQGEGKLLYVFMPWVRDEGVKEATYRIEAPDHSYRGRVSYIDGAGGYECLEGCEGLGGTYSINAGIAAPGTTRFVVEGATCMTEHGCMGVIVGVDLGRLKEAGLQF